MADKTLIVGLGQVGMALLEVLSQADHDCYLKDIDHTYEHQDWWQGPERGDNFDFMHICFPYSEEFSTQVLKLQQEYHIGVTVVHSTVPIGTCGQLPYCVHSPVMGRHSTMASDLLTFTKFVGGGRASAAAEHMRQAGMRVYITDDSRTTEAMKLLSTLFYSVCIEFTKDIKRLCQEYGLPFELWTLWTDAYNTGVVARGDSELVRPNLVPILQPLGGHCLQPNLDLIDSPWAEFIRSRQDE